MCTTLYTTGSRSCVHTFTKDAAISPLIQVQAMQCKSTQLGLSQFVLVPFYVSCALCFLGPPDEGSTTALYTAYHKFPSDTTVAANEMVMEVVPLTTPVNTTGSIGKCVGNYSQQYQTSVLPSRALLVCALVPCNITCLFSSGRLLLLLCCFCYHFWVQLYFSGA